MKKLLTIVSLASLLLAGCATADAPAADEQADTSSEGTTTTTPEADADPETLSGEYYKNGYGGEILRFTAEDGRKFFVSNQAEADEMLNIVDQKETCADFHGDAEVELNGIKEVERAYEKTFEANIVSVKSSSEPICEVR